MKVKTFLFSIVMSVMFMMSPMIHAEPSVMSPSYQVDFNSPTADDNLNIGDTVAHVAVRRTSQYQTANVDVKFKQPGSTQNCSSCHSAVQITASVVGISGGDPIGIKSY